MIRRKPQKSLRTVLMLWFLVFSLVPLTFITGYSLRTYQSAVTSEVKQRLRGNAREVAVIIGEFEKLLVTASRTHLTEPGLPYYLATNNFQMARRFAFQWMTNRAAGRISLFNREGCFLTSVFSGPNGVPQSVPNVESGNICAEEGFLKRTVGRNQVFVVEPTNQKTLDLVLFTVVRNQKRDVAGYIEQVISLDDTLLGSLKKRMNLELAVLDSTGTVISASHVDLDRLPRAFFGKEIALSEGQFRNLSIRDNPFAFFVSQIKWGDQRFAMALGASKASSNAVLRSITLALLIIGIVMIILLVIVSVVSSRMILRPLSRLVEATQELEEGDKVVEVPLQSDNELGVLTESFNEMSRRIAQARDDLRAKIRELEQAYAELKETQTRLIHTAKMASLGQLVAGVAHELNNPIGFIYSNMSHLRQYSDRLLQLIEVAEKKPDELKSKKEEFEFNYMVEDMPRLIKSCEEGARRTRDIVLGLRNFSRLEEAKIKKVDLREGLENTLQLLSGDLKNRIKVVTDYQPVPEVWCYPSQINQVFMNLLANAAQAIVGEGQISIKLEHIKGRKRGAGEVKLTIEDSGKGMTQDVVEKIFDPFFTTKGVGVGTGLGLSISYGIIKKHNGEIQVKSAPAKGTTFIVTLPVQGLAGE